MSKAELRKKRDEERERMETELAACKTKGRTARIKAWVAARRHARERNGHDD